MRIVCNLQGGLQYTLTHTVRRELSDVRKFLFFSPSDEIILTTSSKKSCQYVKENHSDIPAIVLRKLS